MNTCFDGAILKSIIKMSHGGGKTYDCTIYRRKIYSLAATVVYEVDVLCDGKMFDTSATRGKAKAWKVGILKKLRVVV